MTARVLVIGDALLDVHARPTEPVRRGSDVPAEVRIGPGGQGANLAVRLARRGVDVELLCALADDVAGRTVRDALRADGVLLREAAVASTGIVVVLGDRHGERSMLSQRATFAERAAELLPPDAAWIIVSGYLLHEPSAPVLARALAALPGRRAVVGCAVPDALLPGWRSALDELRADLVVANRAEAARLGLDPQRFGLAVTDPDGAVVTIGGRRAEARTPAGSRASDTTGSGDAFAAALVAALLDARWPPEPGAIRDAVEAATSAGAAVARVAGAQAPTSGEPVRDGARR